ncbi:hypothetical protein ABT112_27840, partial [Streptomyces sp. NPDC002055]|uniref:hypothetical protein n=1 Tax=Streptomyces sp. NPDC002055 TaxID=3154534 RepID=UPI003330B6FF
FRASYVACGVSALTPAVSSQARDQAAMSRPEAGDAQRQRGAGHAREGSSEPRGPPGTAAETELHPACRRFTLVPGDAAVNSE